MPDVNEEISRYQYEFRSVPDENVEMLFLFADNEEPMAMIMFSDKDKPLPGPKEAPSGIVVLTYHRHALSGIIDMLRNEKPIYFCWSAEHRIAHITTELEPPGEEEFHSLWSQLFG
jgi:hypothetical protein